MNQPMPASVTQARRLPAVSPLSHAVRGALALSVVAGIALAPSAFAATFTVTSTADNMADGTLRWAISQANTAPDADVITFANGVSGTISLTNGSLYITQPLTITGPGADTLTVDGGNVVATPLAAHTMAEGIYGSVFVIGPSARQTCSSRCIEAAAAGTAMPVTISNLTIRGGSANSGGGIYAANTALTVQHCTITGNQAGYVGGGIYTGTYSSGSATVTGATTTIEDSTISGNDGHYAGGGVYIIDADALTLSRTSITGNTVIYAGGGAFIQDTTAASIDASTISGNTVGSSANSSFAGGGGIHASNTPLTLSNSTISGNQTITSNSVAYGGGIYFRATPYAGLTMVNATVTQNTADHGGGMSVRQTYGSVSLTFVTHAAGDGDIDISNTVIANNTGAEGPAVYTYGSSGPSATFNLSHSFLPSIVGNATVNDDGTNQFASDPGLGPLANNGGPTMTQMPLPTSNLIDRGGGNPSGASFDQRGTPFARVVGSAIDIGAVEMQAAAPPIAASVPVPTLGNGGKLTLGGLLTLAGLLLTRRRKQYRKPL